MGWLSSQMKQLVNRVAGESPVEFTFVPSISVAEGANSHIPGIGEAIEWDECYLELYLESLRLKRSRRFLSRFHGLVYSSVTLARDGQKRAQLTSVSKPNALAELDEGALDRVITVSKQMMGPTAYRGGPISLEFGLFSVKSGDLLSPVLDYVTRVSSVAGISFVGAIKPFLPLITEGMDLISGQAADTELEVGVDTDLTLEKSCVAAIIAKPKAEIAGEQLSLAADRTLLLAGKPLDCGYAVFSVRRSERKADYGEIPELREAFSQLRTAIGKGKRDDAEVALRAFRLATIASADLIPTDAEKLYAKAKRRFDAAFGEEASETFEAVGPVGEEDWQEALAGGESLFDLGLYD